MEVQVVEQLPIIVVVEVAVLVAQVNQIILELHQTQQMLLMEELELQQVFLVHQQDMLEAVVVEVFLL